MEPYDALLRDLQRVSIKPHGLISRAMAAIATLRERCEDFRKRNDYLERVQKDRAEVGK